MARKIDKMPRRRFNAGREKYDYAAWFDGDPWELVGGEDFDGPATRFRDTLTSAARRHGIETRTCILDGNVYVQAVNGE